MSPGTWVLFLWRFVIPVLLGMVFQRLGFKINQLAGSPLRLELIAWAGVVVGVMASWFACSPASPGTKTIVVGLAVMSIGIITMIVGAMRP